MPRNPFIDELHRIREAHAKRFNYDIDAIFEDLKRREAGCKNLSTLRPVRPRLPVREVAEAPVRYASQPEEPKVRRGRA